MPVTLDANEFISALQFGGRAIRLLRMADAGDIEIAISEPLLKEVIGVLRDPASRTLPLAFGSAPTPLRRRASSISLDSPEWSNS